MNENCGSCGDGSRWMGQNRGMGMNRTGGMNRMGQRGSCMENTDGNRRGGCGFRRCGEMENRMDRSTQGCGEETEREGCGCMKERREGTEREGCGCMQERRGEREREGCGCMKERDEKEKREGCREEKPVDEMDPGMGYIPWQKFENVLCAEEGFVHGTIFKDLILPFYGRPIDGMGGNATCNRTKKN